MPGKKSAIRRRPSGFSWSSVSRRSNRGRQQDPSNRCPRLIRRRKHPKGARLAPAFVPFLHTVCRTPARRAVVSTEEPKTMPHLSRTLTTPPCDAQALRECVVEKHLPPCAIASQLVTTCD